MPDSSIRIKLSALPTAQKPDLPKQDISSNEPQGQVKQSNATGVQKTRRLGARKKSSVEISVTSNVPELLTDPKPNSSRQGVITDRPDGPPQEKRSKAKDVQRPKRRLALKKSTVNTSTTSSVPEIPGNPKGTSSTEGQSTFSPDVLAQVKQSKATGVKKPKLPVDQNKPDVNTDITSSVSAVLTDPKPTSSKPGANNDRHDVHQLEP